MQFLLIAQLDCVSQSSCEKIITKLSLREIAVIVCPPAVRKLAVVDGRNCEKLGIFRETRTIIRSSFSQFCPVSRKCEKLDNSEKVDP